MLAFAGATGVDAKTSKKKQPRENPKYAAIVIDVATGRVLSSSQPDKIVHPASLTKMMTLYMTFEALQSQRLQLKERVTMSSRAASMSPSKLGIKPGATLKVEDAILAIVTKSANDVSVMMAERIGGTESGFAQQMTSKARALGMSSTRFTNASGLPDPAQVTTARDMAKLGMALLRDFPHYYSYFSRQTFTYNGVVMRNHNRMLSSYRGMDGIKTGFINASGYNLVASAVRDGRRLVGVVFGGQSWQSRNNQMEKLLNEGFDKVKQGPRMMDANAGQPAQHPVLQEASSAAAVDAPVPPRPVMPPFRANDNAVAGNDTGNAAIIMKEEIPAVIASAAGMTAVATAAVPVESTATVNVVTSNAATSQVPRAPYEAAPSPEQPPAAAIPAPIPANIPTVTVPVMPTMEEPATVITPKTASRINSLEVPSPTRKPEGVVQMNPVAKGGNGYVSKTAKPAPTAKPQMVMQLTIPRSQLPSGIPQNQIAKTNTKTGWAVQVGSYASRAQTDQAIRLAQMRLPAHLRSGIPVIVPMKASSGIVFRGRLQGYNERQANEACSKLSTCLVIAPGS